MYNARSIKDLSTLTTGIGIDSRLKPMLPYQLAGVELMLQKQNVLLADEMGLGKTRQVIEYLNSLKILGFNMQQTKVLIVTPATLKLNWQNEIIKWSNFKCNIIQNSKSILSNDTIQIVSYDLLRYQHIVTQTETYRADILIADEAHYLKSNKTKRTQAVRRLLTPKQKRIFITGTPIPTRPIDAHPIIDMLDNSLLTPYNSYRDFAIRYCRAYNSKWGFDVSGNSNISELRQKLQRSILIRRLKKDVLNQLPSKTIKIVILENTSKTEKVLDGEYRYSFNTLINHPHSILMGELAEIRKKIALLKIKESINFIEDTLQNVNKLVVFAYHHEVINTLAKALDSYGVSVLTGKHKAVNRQKAVDDFQNNKNIRIFIGQLTAAGTGITLTAANTIVFVEFSWKPDDINQAIDRCHRIGQTYNVTSIFLAVKNSLDEQMLNSLTVKNNVIKQILN